MNDKNNPEWWMWQMYRQVARLIHEPSEANDQALKTLSSAWRQYCQDNRQHQDLSEG